MGKICAEQGTKMRGIYIRVSVIETGNKVRSYLALGVIIRQIDGCF
jgi:hypothetical protein